VHKRGTLGGQQRGAARHRRHSRGHCQGPHLGGRAGRDEGRLDKLHRSTSPRRRQTQARKLINPGSPLAARMEPDHDLLRTSRPPHPTHHVVVSCRGRKHIALEVLPGPRARRSSIDFDAGPPAHTAEGQQTAVSSGIQKRERVASRMHARMQ
jgi:hypothetical protein